MSDYTMLQLWIVLILSFLIGCTAVTKFPVTFNGDGRVTEPAPQIAPTDTSAMAYWGMGG